MLIIEERGKLEFLEEKISFAAEKRTKSKLS